MSVFRWWRLELKQPNLRRDALWMIVGQVAAIVLQIGFFLLLIRVLDTYQYGVFIGVTALVAAIAQFATLGQGMVLIRQMAQADVVFGEAWGTALRTAMWGASVTGIFAWLAGVVLLRNPALTAILPLVILSDLICNKLVELASQAFQASSHFRIASQVNILPNLAKMAAVIFAIMQMHWTGERLTVEQWMFWYLGCSVVGTVVALLWVRRRLGQSRGERFARESIREGLSYAVSGASFYIYNDIDKTFLVADGFVSEAGFYGAAYRLIEVMTAPLRALNTAAMPRFFAAGREGTKAVQRLMLRVLAPSALFSFICGLLVFRFHGSAGGLLGREYGAAGQVLRYLCFIPLIRSLHYAAGNALTGLGSQWLRTSIQIGAAVFNIAINFYLIPRFRWQGAAGSSVATELLLASCMSMALVITFRRRRKRTELPTMADEVIAPYEEADGRI